MAASAHAAGVARGCSRIMEHRYGLRCSMSADVTLVTPAGHEVAGALRDFSISGVFVETDAQCWRTYLPVEIRLTGWSSGDKVRESAMAMVVRTTPNGVALMFDVLYPSLVATLSAACRSHGPV